MAINTSLLIFKTCCSLIRKSVSVPFQSFCLKARQTLTKARKIISSFVLTIFSQNQFVLKTNEIQINLLQASIKCRAGLHGKSSKTFNQPSANFILNIEKLLFLSSQIEKWSISSSQFSGLMFRLHAFLSFTSTVLIMKISCWIFVVFNLSQTTIRHFLQYKFYQGWKSF